MLNAATLFSALVAAKATGDRDLEKALRSEMLEEHNVVVSFRTGDNEEVEETDVDELPED